MEQIASGSQDSKLRLYLQQCKQLYEKQVHRKGLMTTLSQPAKSSTKKRQQSREEAFESLRSTSGGRETREASKIASRTYEGIQEKNRTSGSLHSSTGHLATKPHPHSSKRPLTDIFVSGASSYTDLSTTRNDHADIVHSNRQHFSKHSSNESLNTTSKRESSGFGRHHSMEPLGKSWPRSSGYESDGAGPLSRSHSQGGIPGFNEGGMQRSPSVATSTESLDIPLRSERAVSYSRLTSGGSEGGRLGEVEERLGLLATQFLYERHDMFKQIHRACESKKNYEWSIDVCTPSM